MADSSTLWFPLFEFQDWSYESTLVLPTAEETAALAGAPVSAKKWAKGTLALGQAFTAPDGGYTLTGALTFAPGIGLAVSATGRQGAGDAPGTFEAKGTGTDGPLKGAVYDLVGWVFAEGPIANNAGRVLRVRGAVRAVRGPDTNPGIEPGKMPLGTVGYFVIERIPQ